MKDKSTKNLRKSMNRGSVEQTTKVYQQNGDVMNLAEKKVISVPPSKSIKDTANLMIEHEFRRLPVTDPGSGKVLGIVTAMDILNFLGGGDKSNIIKYKFDDNYLAAINESVREIMTRDVITMSNKSSIGDTIKNMISNHVGAIPIVDGDKKLVGIVTERDFALALAGVLTDELVEDYMTTDVITITPGTPLETSSKLMVRNSFRRAPVVEEDKLIGIITSTDILSFFVDKKCFSQMTSNKGTDVLNTKISEIMEKNMVTMEPLTRLGDLCEVFKEKNIGGVPVVKNGVLLGIITERDILKAININ